MHLTPSFLLDPLLPSHVSSFIFHSLSCLYFARKCGRREGKEKDRCLPKHYVQRPVISLSHPQLQNPAQLSPFDISCKASYSTKSQQQHVRDSRSFFAIAILYLLLLVRDYGDTTRQLLLNPFLPDQQLSLLSPLVAEIVFCIRNRVYVNS